MPSHLPTHKALFIRMYHKMSHKVPSVSERLLTCCTCVSYLTSVNYKLWYSRPLIEQTNGAGGSIKLKISMIYKVYFKAYKIIPIKKKKDFLPVNITRNLMHCAYECSVFKLSQTSVIIHQNKYRPVCCSSSHTKQPHLCDG